MQKVEQGDLLKVGGLSFPVIVVSNDFFNESGKAIVCPIVAHAAEGPLHIRMKDSPIEGYVLCEQVRFVDLAARRFSKLTASHYFDIMDISDAVMSMFDYQAL
ncbi:MAG: type II toxin-antitoxin system PemK/MazF family toxin [Clostridia bacterium]|nr:type II toxin-antitoxin system PemK/MazF family toxin [Clostridia bacterium]